MDYNNYIGLPYKDNGRDESGIDCWGLVRLFYKREYDIDIPSYTEQYVGRDDPTLTATITKFKADSWIKTNEPEPGNVVLFNILGQPTHVGIYLGEGKFLHSRGGLDSVVESTTNTKWKNRIEGYYKYSPIVEIHGNEHPLKTKVITDVVVAGTTVAQLAARLQERYEIPAELLETIVVIIDGEVVPKDNWETTVLCENQHIAYKFLPKGGNGTRLFLTVLMVVAIAYGQAWVADMAKAGAWSTGATAVAQAAVSMAIAAAGTTLINAIAPIRPPTQNDPGQGKGVNLFNGSSNQVNKFGAIPVVLGKVRMTAMHGAQPYSETLTDTSLLHLMLVWGFGPLQIDDVQVGTKDITELGSETDTPTIMEHFHGHASESSTSVDSKYPVDIEQQYPNVILSNTEADPVNYAVVSLVNKCEDIDVVLNFPEGMRSISTDTGDVHPAQAGIEILYRKQGDTAWNNVVPYSFGNYAAGNFNVVAKTVNILPSRIVTSNGYEDSTTTTLYRWHVICLNQEGQIQTFIGTPFDQANGTISQWLRDLYATSSYKSLVSSTTNNVYNIYPDIPNGYIKLYSIKEYNNTRVEVQNHVTGYQGAQGFNIVSYEDLIEGGYGDQGPITVGMKVNIAAGKIISTGQPVTGTVTQVFNGRQFTGVVNAPDTAHQWARFLTNNRFWLPNNNAQSLDITQSVNFPYTGYYNIEFSVDDYGSVYIGGTKVISIDKNGYNDILSATEYVTAGTHDVRVKAYNTGGAKAAALNISFTANIGLNAPSTSATLLDFGSQGFFYKRKDAFNFVHRIRGLPRDYYEIKVIRNTTSDQEQASVEKRRFYYSSTLYSVVGYDRHDDAGKVKAIITDPPGTKIARSYFRIQSTNKVNGIVDGINALVQSIAYDWDTTTNKWELRPTSNPASLFLMVLMHTGNAYKISPDTIHLKVDEQAFKDWHAFCKTGHNGVSYEYNNVVTSTTSVMDMLRDIAAAGKASPAFVDGKWTIIVDKPRTGVVQHFTTNNSWGFEATKVLPRIPDAFRVSFINQEKAYQPDEFLVHKDPASTATARIFEELQLPGVTKYEQAKHFAQWHMAQLLLRPETYTLNVDFEYLICTRGDLVRVTHDVPMWGTGSARIKSCSQLSNEIDLTEELLLEAGKQYNIRVRTQTGASELITISSITSTGYYSTITISGQLPAGVNNDDLVMVGEVNKETQELIVLSVEPGSDMSARLTLCDYSPEIYTANLDAGYPAFNPNITTINADVILNSILAVPTITSIVSDSPMSEEISRGIFQNVLQVSFANSADAGKNAVRIEMQIIPSDEIFDNNSPQNILSVLKEVATIRVTSLITGKIYKLRARYSNATGSIKGQWGETTYVNNIGRVSNASIVPSVVLDLNGTEIVATVPQTFVKASDFKCFEYRLFKDIGTEDFWDLDVVTNNILIQQSQGDGKFNLLSVPLPRISEAGITYRVACRTLSNNGNYSTISALGTIVIKTIQ